MLRLPLLHDSSSDLSMHSTLRAFTSGTILGQAIPPEKLGSTYRILRLNIIPLIGTPLTQ